MKNKLFFPQFVKSGSHSKSRVSPFLRSLGADFKLLIALFILQMLDLLFDQNSCLFLSL